jgi:dynein heavy chain
MIFVFSMGEPGGGRTFLTPRFLRHCNLVSVTVFDEETLNRIFMTLLTVSFKNHSEERHLPNLLSNCITLYNECVNILLPTPTKSHYLFNLRDFSKLVLGICRADK